MSATAFSSPTKESSPAARQDLPSESHNLRQHPETTPGEPPQDAEAEAVSDHGGDGAAVADPAESGSDESIAPREDRDAPRASTSPVLASAKTGVEEEGKAASNMAGKLPGTDEADDGGQGEHATAVEENAPIAGGLEQAETDSVAPASEAVEPDENDRLGPGAREEPGSGGEACSESGDGGTASGTEAEAGAEADTEKLVGDGDKPGVAAATLEPETVSGDDVGEVGAMGGGVAEDFFAGDNSSGEDELYPGAAATAGGASGALATRFSGSDQDRPEPPASEQPPSPRIIASSVQGGFRSPVATQRSETAAAKGGEEQGLSEAAKAAVAAALANAASARGDDGGSKSRKKKKSHKERRRKRSGSGSAGEDDSGVGSRGSGSVGRSEVDGGGRTKRSSSRRHHRKSAVG